MLKKKKDIRVELLSYINEKNEIEYYPRCGFPIETYVIIENTKTNLFTIENLNSSNFIFLTQNNVTNDIAAILKKLMFIGTYTLFDHFSFELNSIQTIPYLSYNKANYNNFIVVSNIFLSHFLDTKIIQLQFSFKKHKMVSNSIIFSNAVWLERENSEMFHISYKHLTDTRKLLLDYTTPRGIMLKESTINPYANYYKNYYGVCYYMN